MRGDSEPKGPAAWGLTQILALAATLAGFAVIVQQAPEPVADRMVEADMRDAAEVWQMRIQRQLAAGTVTFLNGSLTPADEEFLRSITRTSDIHRINLLDLEERIFWSSNPDLIGTSHEEGEEDGTQVDPHEATYEVDDFAVGEIDDFALHVAQTDPLAVRQVADIDYPVSLNGILAGAIEFHRDVTQVRHAYIGRVRAVLVGMSGLSLLMLMAMLLIQRRASRAEVRSAQARAREQQAMADEQLRLTQEVRLLGELNEWLQSCRSLDELFSMVARFMSHILPGSAGSLYVYSNSRDVLEGAASWSGGEHRDHIRPEDCWALRRGRTYSFGGNEVNFACGHLHGTPENYVCIPILAHGETIGLMTLAPSPGTPAETFEAQRRIAQTSAEQISLAIANVRMRDELQHQAIRDPLTGLFNQRHMLETLRRLIDSRATRELALVSIDVDHFKRFNDNFGHDAGDMVLRAVGEALGRHADGDDVACRVGGEEFTLLLPGLTLAQAAERAERVRHDVAAVSVRYGDKSLPRVTVSVGVAHCPTHGTMPQPVIRAADEALYAAKARGRNCVVLAGSASESKGDTQPDARDAADWSRDLAAEAAATAVMPARVASA